MEQNPSLEADSCAATKEMPCLLWNSKVRYLIQNSPPLVPILSQIHPIHTFLPYFPKIHSNVILPSTLRCSKRSFPSDFAI